MFERVKAWVKWDQSSAVCQIAGKLDSFATEAGKTVPFFSRQRAIIRTCNPMLPCQNAYDVRRASVCLERF